MPQATIRVEKAYNAVKEVLADFLTAKEFRDMEFSFVGAGLLDFIDSKSTKPVLHAYFAEEKHAHLTSKRILKELGLENVSEVQYTSGVIVYNLPEVPEVPSATITPVFNGFYLDFEDYSVMLHTEVTGDAEDLAKVQPYCHQQCFYTPDEFCTPAFATMSYEYGDLFPNTIHNVAVKTAALQLIQLMDDGYEIDNLNYLNMVARAHLLGGSECDWYFVDGYQLHNTWTNQHHQEPMKFVYRQNEIKENLRQQVENFLASIPDEEFRKELEGNLTVSGFACIQSLYSGRKFINLHHGTAEKFMDYIERKDPEEEFWQCYTGGIVNYWVNSTSLPHPEDKTPDNFNIEKVWYSYSDDTLHNAELLDDVRLVESHNYYAVADEFLENKNLYPSVQQLWYWLESCSQTSSTSEVTSYIEPISPLSEIMLNWAKTCDCLIEGDWGSEWDYPVLRIEELEEIIRNQI